MARQILKPLTRASERRVTIDAVMRVVAEHHGLQTGQLKQKTNAHEISRPRQIAMYLIKELTTASLPEKRPILEASITRRCCTQSARWKSCARKIPISTALSRA